jgi:hypothetical protein
MWLIETISPGGGFREAWWRLLLEPASTIELDADLFEFCFDLFMEVS